MAKDPKKKWKDYLDGKKPAEYVLIPFDKEDEAIFNRIKGNKKTITKKTNDE